MSREDLFGKAPAVLVGLLLAGIAQYAAWSLTLGYGGEQDIVWLQPFFYSLILFIAYPVVLARIASPAPRRAIDLGLVGVALLADLLLVIQVATNDGNYPAIEFMLGWSYVWIVFWLYWQVQAVVTLRGRWRGAERPRPIGDGAALFGGLALASLQFGALMLNAMGEGWGTPYLPTLLQFFAYPILFLRLRDREDTSILADVVLILLGAAADVLIVLGTQGELYYFNRVYNTASLLIFLWGGFWLFWQILALVSLARHMARRDEDRAASTA
jgi:hypothetical protein